MLVTMKTIIIKALPYFLFLVLGVWLTHSYLSVKAELSNTKFELANMTNRATSAEYSLEQEKKFAKEREEWRAELDKKFKEFDASLSSYTQTLRGIANERNKNGVNNSLSAPVIGVLKQYTNTNKNNWI